MNNISLVADFDLFALGWTSPYVPETLFINVAWKTLKWDKIKDKLLFIVAMINFESVQNTLRRIDLKEYCFKLDNLIEKKPELLSWLDFMEI